MSGEKQMENYRAWINQPSTLQPLHKYHGLTGIVADKGDRMVEIYFTEGPVESMRIPREVITRRKRGPVAGDFSNE